MANLTGPAIPDDVAAMFLGGVPVIDAASAAGITVPPGLGTVSPPTQAPSAAPSPPATPAYDPAAAFKAAVAQGLAVNAPQPAVADAPPAAQPLAKPAPAPQGGAAALAVPKPAPVTRYVGGKPRRQDVLLEWPIEVDGVLWTSIPVERMTGRELDAFYDAPAEERGYLPTVRVPATVLDALDADDLVKVRAVALDFLPQALAEAIASTPALSDMSSDTHADSLVKA